MTPKDASITDANVGNTELSPMDITKLQRSYYCTGTTQVICIPILIYLEYPKELVGKVVKLYHSNSLF